MKFSIKFEKNHRPQTFKSTLLVITDQWKFRVVTSIPKAVAILKASLEKVTNRRLEIGDQFQVEIYDLEFFEAIKQVKEIEEKGRQAMYKDFRKAVFGDKKFVLVVG